MEVKNSHGNLKKGITFLTPTLSAACQSYLAIEDEEVA